MYHHAEKSDLPRCGCWRFKRLWRQRLHLRHHRTRRNFVLLGDYTQLGISNSLVSPAGSTVSMDVVDVACGLYHVCALTADGRVNCFGEDNYGEGQSTLTLSEAFPTQVAVGADHTCVAGAVPNPVYCWGQRQWSAWYLLGGSAPRHASGSTFTGGLLLTLNPRRCELGIAT